MMNNCMKEFNKDFKELLKKYSIDEVILANFDDEQMGFHQLSKIEEDEDGRMLILAFSGKDDYLCCHCEKK